MRANKIFVEGSKDWILKDDDENPLREHTRRLRNDNKQKNVPKTQSIRP